MGIESPEGKSVEKAVLYINNSTSTCGACNKNADPSEESHEMKTMYGVGCGVTYTHVSTHSPGLTVLGVSIEERIQEMRPDLTKC